jgi:hypothetical protein
MARKKVWPAHKYYAHYNKADGKIFSISNERIVGHEQTVEIAFEEYSEFIEGAKKLNDYAVGYSKNNLGKTVLSLMQITDQMYGFRNSLFEWITDPPVKDTELTVEWNSNAKVWKFSLSEIAKTRMTDNIVTSIPFFVLLENDFDFLIRTIVVEIKDLIDNTVEIPFVSKFENHIKHISIASRLTFESYGLIINEHN